MVYALALLVPTAMAAMVAAAPIRFHPRAFALQDYSAFQISDGVAGNAEAEAAAVFVTPFAGLDLASISNVDASNVETMRKAAEAAETDQFNPAIEAASGADADALKVGKTKNKVLKLSAEVQVLKIKLAKAQATGGSTADIQKKLSEEQTKLNKNIATDKASAGSPSKGVVGGSTKAATPATAQTKSTTSVKSTATEKAASTNAAVATGSTFKLLNYAQFQISDGVAGNAETEASAIFVTPFAGQDLATVSDQTQKDIETMRQAAEAAETEKFNPAIEAATGAEADALQVGKIKNKVLKLLAEVQVLKIKLAKAKAAGKDTTSAQSKLSQEQAKLDKNIATDKAKAGSASKGVA